MGSAIDKLVGATPTVSKIPPVQNAKKQSAIDSLVSPSTAQNQPAGLPLPPKLISKSPFNPKTPGHDEFMLQTAQRLPSQGLMANVGNFFGAIPKAVKTAVDTLAPSAIKQNLTPPNLESPKTSTASQFGAGLLDMFSPRNLKTTAKQIAGIDSPNSYVQAPTFAKAASTVLNLPTEIANVATKTVTAPVVISKNQQLSFNWDSVKQIYKDAPDLVDIGADIGGSFTNPAKTLPNGQVAPSVTGAAIGAFFGELLRQGLGTYLMGKAGNLLSTTKTPKIYDSQDIRGFIKNPIDVNSNKISMTPAQKARMTSLADLMDKENIVIDSTGSRPAGGVRQVVGEALGGNPETDISSKFKVYTKLASGEKVDLSGKVLLGAGENPGLLGSPEVLPTPIIQAGVQAKPLVISGSSAVDRLVSGQQSAKIPSVIEPAVEQQQAYDAGTKLIEQHIANNEAVVLDSDKLKEITGNNNTQNHPVYSKAITQLYQEILPKVQNPLVKFTAGGPGSGKTDFVTDIIKQDFNGIILEGTLANYEDFKSRALEAFQHDKQIEVNQVLSDPQIAWKYVQVRGEKTGRYIPLEGFIDRHLGAINTILTISKNHPEIQIRMKDIRNVKSKEEAIDSPFITDRKQIIDILSNLPYNKETLRKQLYGQQRVQQISGEEQNSGRPVPQGNGTPERTVQTAGERQKVGRLPGSRRSDQGLKNPRTAANKSPEPIRGKSFVAEENARKYVAELKAKGISADIRKVEVGPKVYQYEVIEAPKKKAPTFERATIKTKIQPDWAKSDDLTPGIIEQLQSAEPGKRMGLNYGNDSETIAWKSTFPDWIPSDLRLSSIVKPVAKHLANGTLPTSKKQIELYNYIAEMIGAEDLARQEGIAEANKLAIGEEDINKLISEAQAEEAANDQKIEDTNHEQRAVQNENQTKGQNQAAQRDQGGARKQKQVIRHYTLPENVNKILSEGFDTSKPPIHGVGGLEAGAKNAKFGKDTLYFTLDNNRWDTAEIFVGEGKGTISRKAYDYTKQGWTEEKNAYKKVNLQPVEATLTDSAKVLTVDNLQKGLDIIRRHGNFDKYSFVEDLLAAARAEGFDVVNIQPGEGWKSQELGTNKFGQEDWYKTLTGNSGNNDFFVLNKDAVELAKPVEGLPGTNPRSIGLSRAQKRANKNAATVLGRSAFSDLPESTKQNLSNNLDKFLNRQKNSSIEGFNPKNLADLEKPVAVKETDKIIKRSEIAKELSDKLGVPIRRGKFRRPGAIGIFKSEPKVIRIKKGGLPVVFHEVAHFLDDKFNFSSILDKTEREALMEEYAVKHDGNVIKQQHEGFAEFVRFQMTGQEARANTMAPKFAEAFEARLKDLPEIKDVLDTAAANYKRWQEQPAVAKVLSNISFEEKRPEGLANKTKAAKNWLTSNLHILYTNFVDDLHPLAEFSKLGKKVGINLPAEADPYILARNIRGWAGKAETFLEKGTFGKNYWEEKDGKIVAKFTGPGLTKILEPVTKLNALNDFSAYLVSKRTIDLASREKPIETGVTKADAEAAITELDKKYPKFESVAEDLQKYQDSLLQYAMENGLIGPEGLKKIKEVNKFYAPLFRVMEEERSAFMGGKKIAGNLGSPIKKIKGSERDIVNPLESVIKNTYAIINAAERNNVGIMMANLAKSHFELGRLFEKVDKPMKPVTVNVKEVIDKMTAGLGLDMPENLQEELGDQMVTLFRPTFDAGPNMLNVNFGDKSQVFQVDPFLFRSIQGLNEEDLGMVFRVLAIPARALRAGATLSPNFAVRNPIRDQFSAMIFSENGYRPGVDLAKGVFELFKKGDVYDLWRMSGGEHSMEASLDRGKVQKKLSAFGRSKTGTIINIAKHPIDDLRAISEISEQATRLGEMARALSFGKSPIQAAFDSREVTLDFARRGVYVKAINSIVAFFNSNVQGLDKFLRTSGKYPLRTLLKLLLGITIPSILLYYANRKDPRWKEIPQWEKNTYWIFSIPGVPIIKIPKPFGLEGEFANVPENILQYLDTKDKTIFNDLEQSIKDNVAPGWIPTGMLPIIEWQSNHSFFLDRPIVTPSQQNLPPSMQYGTYTTEIAKLIGEELGMSPSKIDSFVYGYTGGLGKYATAGIDKVLKGTGIVNPPVAPEAPFEMTPILQAFMIPSPLGTNSESVNKIYNLNTQAAQDLAGVKKLISQGENEKAAAFVKEHPDLKNAKLLNTVVVSFSKINKARDAIRDSRTISAKDKADKIAKLDKTETYIAEEILKELK